MFAENPLLGRVLGTRRKAHVSRIGVESTL